MKQKIVLIEDDMTQKMILTAMLQDHYALSHHATCRTALDALRTQAPAPDLILCDINLPDGNGIMLRQALQREKHLKSAPFIFLTGDSDDATRNQAMTLGIDDYIEKPVRQQDLLNIIQRTLTRSHQLQTAMNERLEETLNQTLQPGLPQQLDTYHLALRYREASAGGGDFVFHHQMAGTDYIIIGDVMGHGAPAKFFLHAYTGYLYGMLRSFQHHDMVPRASDIMMVLNTTLLDDRFLSRWMFSCCVVTLGQNGQTSISLGGHPPPWVTTSQRTHPLDISAMLPGLSSKAVFPEINYVLNKGDRLLLTTDGVLLSSETVCASHALGLPAAADTLFSATDITDDATLVLIECG